MSCCNKAGLTSKFEIAMLQYRKRYELLQLDMVLIWILKKMLQYRKRYELLQRCLDEYEANSVLSEVTIPQAVWAVATFALSATMLMLIGYNTASGMSCCNWMDDCI